MPGKGVYGMKKAVALMLSALILAVAVSTSVATPQKAKQTGKDCSSCHKGGKTGPDGK